MFPDFFRTLQKPWFTERINFDPCVTSRNVPGPALSRGQRSDLGPVRPHVRQSHLVQIHGEKLLVLPQVTEDTRQRETKNLTGRNVCLCVCIFSLLQKFEVFLLRLSVDRLE